MIVTWIAIQSQPLPWVEQRTDVAYVACGEGAGELSLIRSAEASRDPSVNRMLESIERAISSQKAAPSLDWLWRAMPDQGTSIRLSSPQRCWASSYEEQVHRLASRASSDVLG